MLPKVLAAKLIGMTISSIAVLERLVLEPLPEVAIHEATQWCEAVRPEVLEMYRAGSEKGIGYQGFRYNAETKQCINVHTRLPGLNFNYIGECGSHIDLDFRSVNLEGGFRTGSLRGSDFRYSNLQAANLADSKLQGADISCSLLDGTTFSLAEMDSVKLISASMQQAMLNNVKAKYSSFWGADLSSATLSNSDFTSSSFKEATLGNAFALNTNFEDAIFDKALMYDSEFRNSKLRGATFLGSNLRNAVFSGSDLTNVKFNGADIRGASFNNCILNNTDFNDAIYDENTDLDLDYVPYQLSPNKEQNLNFIFNSSKNSVRVIYGGLSKTNLEYLNNKNKKVVLRPRMVDYEYPFSTYWNGFFKNYPKLVNPNSFNGLIRLDASTKSWMAFYGLKGIQPQLQGTSIDRLEIANSNLEGVDLSSSQIIALDLLSCVNLSRLKLDNLVVGEINIGDLGFRKSIDFDMADPDNIAGVVNVIEKVKIVKSFSIREVGTVSHNERQEVSFSWLKTMMLKLCSAYSQGNRLGKVVPEVILYRTVKSFGFESGISPEECSNFLDLVVIAIKIERESKDGVSYQLDQYPIFRTIPHAFVLIIIGEDIMLTNNHFPDLKGLGSIEIRDTTVRLPGLCYIELFEFYLMKATWNHCRKINIYDTKLVSVDEQNNIKDESNFTYFDEFIGYNWWGWCEDDSFHSPYLKVELFQRKERLQGRCYERIEKMKGKKMSQEEKEAAIFPL